MKRKYKTKNKLTHVKLYQYLKDIGATQEEFAESMGFTAVAVHGWLRGKRKPCPKSIGILNAASGGFLTFEDFYGDNATYAYL